MTPRGECRFCHHTALEPKLLPNGDECAFVTERADRCNHPACWRAFWAENDRLCAADRARRRMLAAMRHGRPRRKFRSKAA